jgi:hypothetical protein
MFRRVAVNTTRFVLGAVVAYSVGFFGYGYFFEPPKPEFTAERIGQIKVATEALETFAQNLPDCSKGFPIGSRKEIWDAYIRYCEPGADVPKGQK